MRAGFVLLALIALAPAGPASGQARIVAPVEAPIPAAQRARAMELATLMNPPARMLEQNMVGWEAAITRTLALEPAAAKLEEEYPGMRKAAVEAARPLARRYCEEGVQKAIAAKADRFARRLSASELDQAIAFFSAPAGRRFIEGLLANTDVAAMGRDIAAQRADTGSGMISADRLAQGDRMAVRRTTGELSAPDNVELLRFSQTPASRKLQAASREADRIILEIINHPDPNWSEGQNRLVTQAMIDFIDTRSPKK